MGILSKVPDRGDPSDILQLFPTLNIQLLCCRYWLLKHWEFRELSFPYWRVYHNSREGAVAHFEGREYALSPDKILMIAPKTAYASHLMDNAVPREGYHFEGVRMGEEQVPGYSDANSIPHLFIHFNIGVPYDHISPGIFEFELTDHLQEKLSAIKEHLMVDYSMFNFSTVLVIQSLIFDLLSLVPDSKWDQLSNDHRILKVLEHIEAKLYGDLSNQLLAKRAGLATNAFNRLFTEELGTSPQRFVKKKRIDRACTLLHHSDYSIEQVAQETGFADRYHFSKVFKQQTGLSPARYRKEFGVK